MSSFSPAPNRRWLVLSLLGPCLLVVAALWLVLPQHLWVRPGPIQVVLVDASGKELIDTLAEFHLDGRRLGPLDTFRIKRGMHRIDIAPLTVPVSASDFDFEPFSRRLTAFGPPVTEVQKVKVTVPGALTHRAHESLQNQLHPPEGTHTVDVELSWPDGGPAGGVTVRCWGKEFLTDEKGRAVCGPVRPHGGSIWAFTPGYAVGAEFEEEDTEVRLELARSLELDITVRGGRPTEMLAINSRELQEEVAASGITPLHLTVPRARTIVCTSRRDFAARETRGACEIATPVVDAGVVDVVLNVGEPGVVTFEPRLRGAPAPELVVYLDRVNSGVLPTKRQEFKVFPGRHILVLNTREGPERYETLFSVDAGGLTDLGVVELAPP